MRSWLTNFTHRGDEGAYAVALTIELTWLSKPQRAQLEALVPDNRHQSDNVVDLWRHFPDRILRLPPPAEPPPSPQRPPRWHWPTARIAALVVVVMASVAFYLFNQTSSDYVSGIGERRVIHLEDGSTVTMNTRSRMRVWLTPRGRDIELMEGEALFDVAHDATRPFRVHIAHTVVEAVGTQFDVYLSRRGTKVSVVEGRVKIFAYHRPAALTLNSNAVAWTDMRTSDFKRPPPPVPVPAGEEAQVSTGNAGSSDFDVERRTVTAAELEHHLAWVNGQLIFENSTLAETVDEFNRYNRRKLVIADPALAQIRLGGAFTSTSVDEFMVELSTLFGIRAVPVDNPTSAGIGSNSGDVIQLKRAPSGPP